MIAKMPSLLKALVLLFVIVSSNQAAFDDGLDIKDYKKVINFLIDSSETPYPLMTEPKAKSKYDYIVIGAGSAGAVIASRLSEDPSISVLVVDAGEREFSLSTVPQNEFILHKSKLYKTLNTVTQKQGAFGLVEKKLYPKLGLGLGGRSALGSLLYGRGNMEIYDEWIKMGAEGWTYQEVLPYFLKSEGLHDYGFSFFDPAFHAGIGPIGVVGGAQPNLVQDRFYRSLLDVGAVLGDYNGFDQFTWGPAQLNLCGGFRCSTARAYLGPASFRPNLDVLESTKALEVLIDDNRRAFGVKLDQRGKVQEVIARREIILSAGAYMSPAILLRSGVGPKKQLSELKIPVKVDLPGVGQNLAYHPSTLLYYTIADEFSKKETPETVLKLQGIIAPRSTNRPFGYYRTKHTRDNFPDIFFEFFDENPAQSLGPNLHGYFNDYNKGVIEKYLKPNSKKPGFVIAITNGRPKSTGSVTLGSSNPYAAPVIDPKIYSETPDVQAMVEACRTATKIIEAGPLQSVGAKPFPNTLPGCEKFPLNSAEYFECHVRTIVIDSGYASGTCKMGFSNDPMAVVDSNLRVYGVKNLRVADTSIFPTSVNTNSPAPAVMIGEKASDIIRNSQLAAVHFDQLLNNFKVAQ